MSTTKLRDKVAHLLCKLIMRHIASPEYRKELGFVTSLGMTIQGTINDLENSELTDEEESGKVDS